MRVDGAPPSASLEVENREASSEEKILYALQRIECVVVPRYVEGHVLPRRNDEEIEIDPPEKEQGEIDIAEMHAQVVAAIVRPQGERTDHRDGVEKEDYVTYVGVGNG